MNYKAVYIFFIWLVCSSCDALFEPSLDQIEFHTIAPQDSTIVDSGRVTFWWKEIEEAEEYQLNLILGSVAVPTRQILDTITKDYQYEAYLSDTGYHYWWVKASNTSSWTLSDTLVMYVKP